MYMFESKTLSTECSLEGNYTFAAVKGQEKYTYLNAALAPVWQEMNDLLGNPYICIGTSYTVRLDIVLGSDYKVREIASVLGRRSCDDYLLSTFQFLLNIMGMNEAFSIYACVWCEIKCSERYEYPHTLHYTCTYMYVTSIKK